MFQLMDFFTIPEFYLLCSIIEFFERGHIGYKPVHVFRDVSSAVARVHKSGLLGLNIMANPGKSPWGTPVLRILSGLSYETLHFLRNHFLPL
ncbi:hypothetical protein PHET_10086 [Paragonimus heterotremus]|uniref:Uncharacterized protein n=1 Tax=Paragonimus heterotremus TaxID=100268 RepID=A0A8J4SK60_9TREM|nr:hypothetical protein PHET_10086 [Paragonimus heterotremus]